MPVKTGHVTTDREARKMMQRFTTGQGTQGPGEGTAATSKPGWGGHPRVRPRASWSDEATEECRRPLGTCEKRSGAEGFLGPKYRLRSFPPEATTAAARGARAPRRATASEQRARGSGGGNRREPPLQQRAGVQKVPGRRAAVEGGSLGLSLSGRL